MKTVLIGTPAMLRTAAFCMPSAAAQIAALHWPAMNSEPPSISAVSTSGRLGEILSFNAISVTITAARKVAIIPR